MSTYKEKLKWLIGRTLNDYYKNIDIKDKVKKNTFTDEYQNRLIKFLLSDVSNQYIVTPLSTDSSFELLYSKKGLAIVTRIIPQKTKLTDDLKMLPTGNKINISSSNGEETSTLNIILDKPLYSMNHNGSPIYDEIIDTNLIKRTVDFLLNGKEDWEIINETLLDNGEEGVVLSTVLKDVNVSPTIALADDFPVILNIEDLIKQEGFLLGDDNELYFTISKKRLSISKEYNIALKEYLAKKPINIVCSRVEPITIKLADNPYSLDIYDNTIITIIDVVNNNTPSCSLKYRIDATYRDAIKENNINAKNNKNDVNSNIIPYLMDMEMNLMSIDEEGEDE